MKRLLVFAVIAGVLSGCSSGGDHTTQMTDSEYLESVQVGPWADYDLETLVDIGVAGCDDMKRAGTAGTRDVVATLESKGFTQDQAVNAVTTMIVRYCPEVAD